MSPHSLFLIVLKVLGIFILKDLIISIPQLMASLVILFRGGADSYMILNSLAVVFVVVLYGIFINLFLFKTEKVISFLQLEDGFKEETINFSLHRSHVLNIALIIFCLYMLILLIPELCKEISVYSSVSQYDSSIFDGGAKSDLFYIVVKILVVICVFIARRPIVNFVELNRKKTGKS